MNNQAKKPFKPYVAASTKMAEVSVLSVVTGLILMLVFGAANAYLGLKIGMTVSASIPAAVVSMAILRGILRRGTILENNIVQTMASTGESVAAGVVFSIPALYMVGYSPSLLLIAFLAAVGGALGVAGMIIFRRYLIVEQADVLPYPEGTACAEILIAGEEGGVSAKKVFQGGALAAAFKFIQTGFMAFPEAVETAIPKLGGVIGFNAMPSLVGVGYLIGTKISFVMLGGGLLAWLVMIPLIQYFGVHVSAVVAPGTIPLAEMDAWGIWESYIQYIAAGTLTVGGISELVRAMPAIRDSLKSIGKAVKKGDKSEAADRTNQDMPMRVILIIIVVCFLAMLFTPAFPSKLLGAFLTTVFALIFVSIASRIVGVVGSSSNPISGMTIATIFCTAIIFQAVGFTGTEGVVASIIVGSVVTIAAATAGDISQDLKTGYIVGASPKWQQWMELFSALLFAGVSGVILMLLHSVYTIGSAAMPAPATAVISILTEAIFSGNLPWGIMLVGVMVGVMLEFLGIPVLPFAIGVYLPVHLSVPICIGGIIKYFVQKKKGYNESFGTLFASGLVAGDALVGVLVALLTYVGLNGPLAFMEGVLGTGAGNIVASIATAIVCVALYRAVFDKTKKEGSR